MKDVFDYIEGNGHKFFDVYENTDDESIHESIHENVIDPMKLHGGGEKPTTKGGGTCIANSNSNTMENYITDILKNPSIEQEKQWLKDYAKSRIGVGYNIHPRIAEYLKKKYPNAQLRDGKMVVIVVDDKEHIIKLGRFKRKEVINNDGVSTNTTD